MKYFFLADGWVVGRVWEFGGIWNELVWRRQPQIEQLSIGIIEQNQTLWLYRVEEAVLMVEVKPTDAVESSETIGQVMLKRLMEAEQVMERLDTSETIVRQQKSQ